MAEVNRRQRYTVYDYSAYDTTKVPRDGEIRFFDTIETWILNRLSVIGDGVSTVAALPFREVIYVETAADIDVSAYNVKGNIIRVHNTDTVDHTLTTGGTPATYTMHPDLPRFYQFDGTNWIEVASPVNYIPIISLSADITLPNYQGDQCFACNGGANGIIVDIPAAADNEYIELNFKRTDSGASSVTLKSTEQIDGFTAASDGYYYIFLVNQWQHISLKSNGSQWCIMGGWLDFSTGGRNTNDWTNAHLGDLVITYDTVTVAFKIGEKVTLGSGVTAIIFNKTASTLTCKKATGTGIAINNETITGSMGGSALVDGSTKATDSNIYHGTGLNKENFNLALSIYAGTTYVDAAAVQVGDFFVMGTPGTFRGHGFIGVDTNYIKCQTASSAIDKIQEDGTNDALTTNDYSFLIKCIKNY